MFLKESRERIEIEYEKRVAMFPSVKEIINAKMSTCIPSVALAMKYLYSTMPVSDMGNYPFETFLDYAAHGVALWQGSKEVRALPEHMFLNYVLYHRINEEEITPCRSFFYEKLKDRVVAKNSREAALAVNYWCAEQATYQSTDDRTLAPLTVYQRGNGRCGEESTFTVSVMRSIGLCARQVYAAKWSHCDDNHAWVEVWCENDWYFMGACEPEPILNKGWFTNASSRAMMVTSRWFDFAKPSEAVIGTAGMVTMLNQLRRYALVETLTVQVQDECGRPVEGAVVSFEVLNYAEFSPIAEVITNGQGKAGLMTGLGSLCVHVSKENLYGNTIVDVKECCNCRVVLKQQQITEGWQSFDIIAPTDAPVNRDTPTKQEKETGDKKSAQAVEKRLQKVEKMVFAEKEAFLDRQKPEQQLRQAMFDVLTEKDQTDARCVVLEEHLCHALPYQRRSEQHIFVPYVLNPRVEDEVLTAYRAAIEEAFTEAEKEQFRQAPASIWDWIQNNMRACPEMERDSLITVPSAALALAVCSLRSQKVLFVAIARTLGIPSRLNPQDKELEYYAQQEFVRIIESTTRNSTLNLEGNGNSFVYFQNWTIGKLKDGRYTTLDLSESKWQNQQLTLTLESGTYRLLTVNRLPNGNIFANQYEFQLLPGETKQIGLAMREADLQDMLENNALPEFELKTQDKTPVAGRSLLKDAMNLMLWLEESKEPTEHILNELLERKEDFCKYASRIFFVLRSKEALLDPTIAKTLRLFPEIQVYYDDFQSNVELLGRRMYVDFEKLPLILVTKGEMNGIYAASGYNVGTGDMLLRLLDM